MNCQVCVPVRIQCWCISRVQSTNHVADVCVIPVISLWFYVFSEGHIEAVLKTDEQVEKLADELVEERSLLVMGRGYNFATCLEGALVTAINHNQGSPQ